MGDHLSKCHYTIWMETEYLNQGLMDATLDRDTKWLLSANFQPLHFNPGSQRALATAYHLPFPEKLSRGQGGEGKASRQGGQRQGLDFLPALYTAVSPTGLVLLSPLSVGPPSLLPAVRVPPLSSQQQFKV